MNDLVMFPRNLDDYKKTLLKYKLTGCLSNLDFNNAEFFLLSHDTHSNLCDEIVIFNMAGFIQFKVVKESGKYYIKIDSSNKDLLIKAENNTFSYGQVTNRVKIYEKLGNRHINSKVYRDVVSLAVLNAENKYGRKSVNINNTQYNCSINTNFVDLDDGDSKEIGIMFYLENEGLALGEIKVNINRGKISCIDFEDYVKFEIRDN